MSSDRSSTESKNDLPKFDPDFSPQHPQNKRAAAARNLSFSRGSYRDADGSMVRDRFGQRY